MVPLVIFAHYSKMLQTLIEYNDVCKSEKEIDKPLGAPVK